MADHGDRTLRGTLQILHEVAGGTVAAGQDVSDLTRDCKEICIRKEMTPDEEAATSALVFDEDLGLFAFARRSLASSCKKDKDFVSARAEVYDLVAEYMGLIGPDNVSSKAIAIKDACLELLAKEDSGKAKAKLARPLSALLEMQPQLTVSGAALDIFALAQKVKHDYMYRKNTHTVLGNDLRLMGLCQEHYPELFSGAPHGSCTPQYLLDESISVVEHAGAGKVDPGWEEGAICAVDSVLAHVDKAGAAAGGGAPGGGPTFPTPEQLAKVYNHILEVLHKADTVSRFAVPRAALGLLARHMPRFRARLEQGAEGVFGKLLVMMNHSNKDMRDFSQAAQQALIRQVSELVVEEGGEARQAEQKRTYEKFMRYITGLARQEKARSKVITTAIRAFGSMAGPTLRFFGVSGVEKLLQHLAQFASTGPLVVASEYADDRFGQAVALLSSYAELARYLPSVDEALLQQLVSVALRVAEAYSELYPKQRKQACDALRDSLLVLEGKGAALPSFLHRLVPGALMHTVKIPADAAAAADTSAGEEPWEVYVELWDSLLQVAAPPAGAPPEARAEAREARVRGLVFDALMLSFADMFKALNLEYSKAPAAGGEGEAEGDREVTAADIGSGLVAQSPVDMQTFLAASEVMQRLLGRYGRVCGKGWVYQLGSQLVDLSFNKPLLSGFYRLIHEILRVAEEVGVFKAGGLGAGETAEADRLLMVELFRGYLLEVLGLSRGFQEELLAAALALLLRAPPALLRPAQLSPALASALRLGLGHLPLAVLAVDTLEGWYESQRAELMGELPALLPHVEPYLGELHVLRTRAGAALGQAAGEGAGDAGAGEEPPPGAAGARGVSHYVERGRAAAEMAAQRGGAGEVESLQRRAQAFLGRVGGAAHAAVTDVDLTAGGAHDDRGTADGAGLAWDSELRLKFDLPLPGASPALYLDPFLPRVVDLAVSSRDRATKAAASEFLHAAVLLMVGTNKRFSGSRGAPANYEHRPTKFYEIYRHLFPKILRLAADVDPIPRRLFEPLALQLVRWFTRNARRENAETMALVEAVLGALGAEGAGATLRDLAARCCKELLEWSIKHLPVDKGDEPHNAKSLFRRLYAFLAHPSPARRGGAALALLHMRPVIRSNRELADTHVMEMFAHSARSLQRSEADPPGSETPVYLKQLLRQLGSVVVRRAATLRLPAAGKSRRGEFEDLGQFAEWLFLQTGAPQRGCRVLCMDLFSSIAGPALPAGSEGPAATPGPAQWFRSQHLEAHMGDLAGATAAFMAPRGGPAGAGPGPAARWLGEVTATFQWSTWSLAQGLFEPGELDLAGDARPGEAHRIRLAPYVQDVVQWTSRASERGWAPQAAAEYDEARARAALSLIELLQAALSHKAVSQVPTYHGALPRLVVDALLQPHLVGLEGTSTLRERIIVEAGKLLTLSARGVKGAPESPLLGAVRGELAARMAPGGPACLASLDIAGGRVPLADLGALCAGYSELVGKVPIRMLPPEVYVTLPKQLLQLALTAGPKAGPHQREGLDTMVYLAMHMGIKDEDLLSALLDLGEGEGAAGPAAIAEGEEGAGKDRAKGPTPGQSFYLNFRARVDEWVIFRHGDGAILPRVLAAAASDGPGRQTAQDLLLSVLRRLTKGGDFRSKGVAAEFCRHISALSPLADSAAPAASRVLLLGFIDLLMQIHPAHVLDPTQPNATWIMDAILRALRPAASMEGAGGRAVMLEALRVSPRALAAVEPQRGRVLAALAEVALSAFPASSQLLAERPDALDEYTEVLGLFQAAVLHCAQHGMPGAGVEVLRVMSSLLQEVGKGMLGLAGPHVAQGEVISWMRRVAEAPWAGGGKGGGTATEAWWGMVFPAGPGGGLPRHARLAAARFLLRPAILATPAPDRQALFASNLGGLMATIASAGTAGSTAGSADTLAGRACAHTVIGALYEAGDKDTVQRALKGATISGEKLEANPLVTKFVKLDAVDLPEQLVERPPAAGAAAWGADAPPAEAERRALLRELRCEAYSALLLGIARVQSKEKAFTMPFLKEPWARLVDCASVHGDFAVETGGRTRDQLRDMWTGRSGRGRAAVPGSAALAGTGYIVSEAAGTQLGMAGLATQAATQGEQSDEASQIMMSQPPSEPEGGGAAPAPPDAGGELGAGTGLEGASDIGGGGDGLVDVVDSLDRHPCLLPLVRMVEQMDRDFGSAWRAEEMPGWMASLRDDLARPSTPINAKLFLVKVVVHVQARHDRRSAQAQVEPPPSVFARYAGQWLGPLVDAMTADPVRSGGARLHYLLRDVCATLLGWSALFAPGAAVGAWGSRLLRHLVKVCPAPSRKVMEENVRLVEMFAAQWDTRAPVAWRDLAPLLEPSDDAKDTRLRARTALVLTARLLYRGVLSLPPGAEEGRAACEAVLGALRDTNTRPGNLRELWRAAGEVAGMLMALRAKDRDEGGAAPDPRDLETPITSMLKQLHQVPQERDRFIRVLERVAASYPPIVEELREQVYSLLPIVHGEFKVMVVRILLRQPRPVELAACLRPQLGALLRGQDEQLQLYSLKLLRAAVDPPGDLPPADEKAVAGLCVGALKLLAAVEMPFEPARAEYHRLLRAVYARRAELRAEEAVRAPLLLALDDPAERLRGEARGFWGGELPGDVAGRLEVLLAALAAHPTLESRWARIACSVALDLPRTVEHLYSKPLFEESLADCKFEEYPISGAWAAATLSLDTPLFHGGLAASLGLAGASQGGDFRATQPGGTQAPVGMVRATAPMTQSLAVTYPSHVTDSMGLWSQVRAGAEPAHGTDSTQPYGSQATQAGGGTQREAAPMRRFIKTTGRGAAEGRGLAIRASMRKRAHQSQAAARAEKITTFRKYRVGELPDIQGLSPASLVDPLQALALTDGPLARAVLPAMVRLQAEGEARGHLVKELGAALAGGRRDPTLVGALLATLAGEKGAWADPGDVGAASLASDNIQAGCLLLEQQILEGAPTSADDDGAARGAARRRGAAGGAPPAEASAEESAWLHLASLYRALGEGDVVLGLHIRFFARSEATRKAVAAQLAGETSLAYDLFSDALDDAEADIPRAEKQLWWKEKLACAADLGDWDYLALDIEEEVGGGKPRDPDGWHLVAMLEGEHRRRLPLFARACINLKDDDRAEELRGQLRGLWQNADEPGRLFLEEAAGLQLALVSVAGGQLDRARALLAAQGRGLRRRWAQLHPLAGALRHDAVLKLQPLVETGDCVALLHRHPGVKVPEPAIAAMVETWLARDPSSAHGGASAWEDLLGARLLLLDCLARHGTKEGAGAPRSAFVVGARATLVMQAARGARRHGDLDLAEEYFTRLEALASGEAGESFSAGLRADLMLEAVRVLMGRGAMHRERGDLPTAATHFADARGQVRDALASLPRDLAMAILELRGLGARASALLASLPQGMAVQSSPSALAVEATNEYIEAAAGCEEGGDDASGVLEAGGRASLNLALWCDELVRARGGEGDAHSVPQEAALRACTAAEAGGGAAKLAVRHMLRAMRLGAPHAWAYVPRALALLAGEGAAAARAEFAAEAPGVPPERLLSWAPQMLAMLELPEGDAVVPALVGLAAHFPQQLHFPFRLSSAHYSQAGSKRAEPVRAALISPLLDELATALSDLPFPDHRWGEWAKEIGASLGRADKTRAGALMAEAWDDVFEEDAIAARGGGSIGTKCARKLRTAAVAALGPRGGKVAGMSPKAFHAAAAGLKEKLQSATQGATGPRALGDFSTWFRDFGARELRGGGAERLVLPGGRATDVHVVGFLPTCTVLASLQRPMKLSFLGDDQREHDFLVKGGEDLRLDQRIQQLFVVMNALLAATPACASRRLHLRTFDVVPVSTTVGLVEWCSGTKTLMDVIAGQAGKDSLSKAQQAYGKWVSSRGDYTKVMSLPPEEVGNNLRARHGEILPEALRRGVHQLAAGPQAYLAMRSRFAATLATFSMASWIAGVGDRHLSNLLLDFHDGSLVGIDFGYSFGTATQLLGVPELVPFRLTRQFLEFLRPLDAEGLLRGSMCHVMRALHERRAVLNGVVGVFMAEPLLNWASESRKIEAHKRQAQKGKQPQDGALEKRMDAEASHVRDKVESARRKLDLGNPMDIILDEVARGMAAIKEGPGYVEAVGRVVRGQGGGGRPRAAAAGKLVCDSVEQQVDVLIDLATDPSVLGRMWQGWAPWL